MYQIQFKQRLLELPETELILIGRGEKCDIQLDDPSASRVHCRVLSRNGNVFLTDAASRWGTFVNGKRIQEVELQIGDEITIGETILQLQRESHAQATTITPRDREYDWATGPRANCGWF